MWFFSTRKARQTPLVRRPRSSFRPRLEVLEDRCVPNAGYLDPTFGAAGAGVIVNAGAGSVLIQPADGKILAMGLRSVTRYNTDSSVDTSFGSGGTQTINFSAGAMALQSDGKILLQGLNGVFDLERLNSNGSPDTSFGTNGIVSESNWYSQVVAQPDGKVVIAGSYESASGTNYLVLARYNANGSPDKSFGQSGLVSTHLPEKNYNPETDALLLQADGKLVVVVDPKFFTEEQWLIARYNTNGSLDASFGSKGIVATTLSLTPNQIGGYVHGAALYPSTGTANDGKLVIVGNNYALASGPLLVRFNTNGSTDTTFGTGGYVPLGVSPSGVAFNSSGGFVVAGSSNSDTALERLNPDGTPDTTFGSGGVVTAGLAGTSGSGAPAIYPSTGTDTADAGKIVTAGSHVARFLPSAPASAPSFVVTGPSSTTAGASFAVTVTATDSNGNVLTNYTGTVDFASLDAQADLPANYTFTTADQGVHTFTVTLKTANLQALFVADTTTPGMNGRQVGLQVNPGPVAQLVFVNRPTSVTSGSGFALYAEALDAYGNRTSFSDTVHFSSSDPNATLPSDKTFPGNGATLGRFVLSTKGTQTITMTDINDPSLFVTITIQVN
jgi:uncharacterized delta-60 repeat protein